MAMRSRGLSDEERMLWGKVALSTVPLKTTVALVPEAGSAATKEPPLPSVASASVAPPVPRKEKAVSRHLDRPTHDRLAKGKVDIEAKLDLHGLTQREAHALLLSFLNRAHASGIRYVLVVTGKGSTWKGDGVLRRMVPEWLATAPFRLLVSGHDSAGRFHGGAGALYVRLRKQLARP